jgi:transposase
VPIPRPRWPGLKKDLPAALAQTADANPGKRIALYFQDEARFGQKGRPCWRWWLRGQRPTGPVDQRYTFAYAFAAVEPLTGRDFCLMLPAVSTAAMAEFLRRFSATLPADEHALMVLDGAGWHTSHDLPIPANLTLLRLPPYSPELNPLERIWLYLRERHLSLRVLEGYEAIVDAICRAWIKLDPKRIASLCYYPWIR